MGARLQSSQHSGRIIKASTNEGDFVLDPFASCTTTFVAVERLRRRWVGKEYGDRAHEVVLDRLKKPGLAVYGISDRLIALGDVQYETEPPQAHRRGDRGRGVPPSPGAHQGTRRLDYEPRRDVRVRGLGANAAISNSTTAVTFS